MKYALDRFADEKRLKADLLRSQLQLYGDRAIARVHARHLRLWESSVAAAQKNSPQWPARRQRFVRDLNAKLYRLWNMLEADRKRGNCWCFDLRQVW